MLQKFIIIISALTLIVTGCYVQSDTDSDGVIDGVDNCVYVYNPEQWDIDGDWVGDLCDNCTETINTDQTDADNDGWGDACDPCPNDPENDSDYDEICGDVDNCPSTMNTDQADSDCDGLGDACSEPDVSDLDCDGILDGCDMDVDLKDEDCDQVPDGCYPPDLTDIDCDGIIDGCDPDVVVPAMSIEGTILTADGSVVPGVIISLAGNAESTAASGSNGAYIFTDLMNGTYIVTPHLDGYYFTPGSIKATIQCNSVNNINFIAEEDPPVTFYRTYGGIDEEKAFNVYQAQDRGYIVSAWTKSFGTGYGDAWLIKTDRTGNVLWENIFGDTRSENQSHAVNITRDNGFISAMAPVVKNISNNNVSLIKIDINGTDEWEKIYTGGFGLYDYATSIEQTLDDGYVTSGHAAPSDGAWIMKADNSGTEEWADLFNINGYVSFFTSVKEAHIGGYIAAGYIQTNTNTTGDALIVKYDDQGFQQWQRVYGNEYIERFNSIERTSDGGYILAGASNGSLATGFRGWLVKILQDGTMEWERTFIGPNAAELFSAQQTYDGGYILAGATGSMAAGGEIWLIRTDSTGTVSWEKKFSGIGTDIACFVRKTSDGGYIVLGETRSYGAGLTDILLIKTDAYGNAPLMPEN